MTDTEVRVRCYEMAFERARAEHAENFLDRVTTIATWLYNGITCVPEPQAAVTAAAKKARNPADKSAES